MNIFLKKRWPEYLPKVQAVWQKIDTAELNHDLTSDERDSSSIGDFIIFIVLIVCAILFWT